jgi:hypothetical protein
MHKIFDCILSISDSKSISYFHDFPPKPAELVKYSVETT